VNTSPAERRSGSGEECREKLKKNGRQTSGNLIWEGGGDQLLCETEETGQGKGGKTKVKSEACQIQRKPTNSSKTIEARTNMYWAIHHRGQPNRVSLESPKGGPSLPEVEKSPRRSETSTGSPRGAANTKERGPSHQRYANQDWGNGLGKEDSKK